MGPEERAYLERLFQEQYRALRYHAYRYLGDFSRAEAVVQEAFVVACRKIDDLKHSPNPAGWMMETVKNISLNEKRALRQYEALVVSLEELGESVLAAEDAPPSLSVEAACAGLVPEEDFRLFRSVVLGEESYQEAAERRGISIWACYKQVRRTAERPKRRLTEPEETIFSEPVQRNPIFDIDRIRGDEHEPEQQPQL